MRKKPIVDVTIETTKFPNTGIAHVEGRSFHIKNAFPGQKFTGQVFKYKQGVGQLRVLEKLQRAPWEIEPVCPHYSHCGGCSSQEVPYDRQLAFKEAEIKNLLQDHDLSFEIDHGIQGAQSQYFYRNKMEYTFGNEAKDAPLALGMHYKNKKNSVKTTDRCQIVPEDFNRILAKTLSHFEKTDLNFYRVLSREGTLRNLIIRHGLHTDELMAILVTTSDERVDAEAWAQDLLNLVLDNKLVSIIHIINDSFQDAVVADEIRVIHGKDHIEEQLLGVRFKITPMSFFQTNSLGAERIYEEVKRLAGNISNKEVFDLYCGTGTIGNILAPEAKFVTGIEIVEEAAQIAQENAALNGNNNTDFQAGDVKDRLQDLTRKPDLIILDPPRSGLHPKALEYAMAFQAPEIIYVSCNPKTMVQDLQTMKRTMKLKEIIYIDNFPNTPHVETVVSLSHKNAETHINVNVEFGDEDGHIPIDEIARKAEEYRPSQKVTYKMIQEYIESKYNFKVHTAYIAEVKRDLGLPMYDAPNAVEELKHERKHPTPQKVEAIKDALRHFGVIQ